MATSLQQRKAIYQRQIFRLAKIYISKPVTVENIPFHNKVAKMQVEVIKKLKALK